MSLIHTVTSIYIEDKTLATLENTITLLDTLSDELAKLADEEERYQDLSDLAQAASFSINDFLRTYAERDL